MPRIEIDPEVSRTRSAVAVATRRRDTAAIAEARRNHAAAKLADVIAKTVAASPPLTDAQRDRLALLLRGAVA